MEKVQPSNVLYNKVTLKQVLKNYDVEDTSTKIDGCRIELSTKALAKSLEAPLKVKNKYQRSSKDQLKQTTKEKPSNQGSPPQRQEHSVVYQLIHEYVSRKGVNTYVYQKHFKMLYGRYKHVHKINVSNEMFVVPKAQMDKAIKSASMVKCGHVWHTLYEDAMKTRRFSASHINLDSSYPIKPYGRGNCNKASHSQKVVDV